MVSTPASVSRVILRGWLAGAEKSKLLLSPKRRLITLVSSKAIAVPDIGLVDPARCSRPMDTAAEPSTLMVNRSESASLVRSAAVKSTPLLLLVRFRPSA